MSSIAALGKQLIPVVFTASLSTLLLGCPNKQLITETPTVENAESQQATCKVAKDPLNPLIVEWPGTAKIDFDSASQRGVVFVSYVGCNLKVLSSCRATTADSIYEMTSVTPARDKLVMSDLSELYARLPLGAASLKGELGLGSSLELDYIAVGQRIAKETPKKFSGDCEGATHFVRTITVGAYSLDAHAAGKAAASVEVGSAGGGLSRQESKRNIRGSGNVESCSSDPLGTSCGAILQLGLAPLTKSNKGEVLNSAGFASGIGPLGQVVVPDLAELSLGNATFRNVDSGYLKLVDDAIRSEKDTSTATANKISKWETVRDARPEGDFVDEANGRIKEWRDVLEAENRRREKLDLLRTRYTDDKNKLNDLLGIQSESLASADQKSAWKKEFDVAYQPYEKELQELGLVGGGASATPVMSTPSYSTNSPPSDTSSGSSFDVTGPAKVGEEIVIIKGDFGMHAQSFGVDTSADEITAALGEDIKPAYDLTGFYAGGQAAVNFDSDSEIGAGIMAYGRYYVQAKLPKEINPSEEATGAFEVGAGFRIATPVDDRIGFSLGIQGGAVKFLNPDENPVCEVSTVQVDPIDGTQSTDATEEEYDPDAIGGNVDLAFGFDFYPLSFMSLGLSGLLGWGHVEAQVCGSKVGMVNPTTPIMEAFGESFSATAAGHLGFHF
ncbi:MAG: hypothetical protein HOV80_01770 [Polyangiaceae bacterium]|nr:hypothetical protein [Polyangiaceae bacterium]